MPHKALTVIALPEMVEREVHPGIVVDVPSGESKRFEPGETITKKDLADAGQSDEQIAELIEFGSLSELDAMDTPLHPDHQPVDPTGATVPEEAATDEAS